MTNEPTAAPAPSANRGWLVTFSGTGINLALGILYAWSLTKGAIEKEFGWKAEQLNDPYALCCLVFAFAMILAGAFLFMAMRRDFTAGSGPDATH